MYFKIIKCIDNSDPAKDKPAKQYRRHNSGSGPEEPLRINREIVDENNQVIGRCNANIYISDAAIINKLWIDKRYRRMGLATELLENIEKISQENGCSSIHLDTFNVGKKEFYISHGYKVFGTREDCPKGHCRYYMKKEF